MLCSREEFGKKIFWLLILKNWETWMHQKYVPEDWMRKKSWQPKKMENLYFLWQMVQQNYQEETTNSKNPLWDGNPPSGERISAENLVAIEKSFNLKNQKMTQKLGKTSGLFKEIAFIVNILNREFNYTCREKNHSLFHWSTLMSSGQLIRRSSRKTNRWLLETETEIC